MTLFPSRAPGVHICSSNLLSKTSAMRWRLHCCSSEQFRGVWTSEPEHCKHEKPSIHSTEFMSRVACSLSLCGLRVSLLLTWRMFISAAYEFLLILSLITYLIVPYTFLIPPIRFPLSSNQTLSTYYSGAVPAGFSISK